MNQETLESLKVGWLGLKEQRRQLKRQIAQLDAQIQEQQGAITLMQNMLGSVESGAEVEAETPERDPDEWPPRPMRHVEDYIRKMGGPPEMVDAETQPLADTPTP